MDVIRVLFQAMISPNKIMNKKVVKGRLIASVLVVLIACVIEAFVFPILYYIRFNNEFVVRLDGFQMVLMFLLAIGTWLFACVVLKWVAGFFKKPIGLSEIFSTWGFSFLPNVICISAYLVWELRLFHPNQVLILVFNTFMIMLLAWKSILYFLQIRIVLGLVKSEVYIATIIIGIIFFILMQINMRLGLQIPML